MAHDLVAYTVVARPRREKDTRRRMGFLKGDETGTPAHAILTDLDAIFVQGSKWTFGSGSKARTGEIVTVCTPQGKPNTRYGRVLVGAAGERSDYVDPATGEKSEVWPDHLRTRPIFYWMTFPPGSRRGLVLTERVGAFSIKGAFWEQHIWGKLRETHDELVFEMAHYYPKDVLEEYLEHGEGVRGATLRGLIKEVDETKELDDPHREVVYGELDVRVKRRMNPVEAVMRRLLKNEMTINEAIELFIPPEAMQDHVEALDMEEIIVELDLGEKIRRVSVKKNTQPRAGYPVTGVGDDDDGYPIENELADFAAELERDLGPGLQWG